MAKPLEQVLQEKYATQAKLAMSVQKPMGLVKFCEKGDATSGESFTFYRAEESTAKDGLPSMYNDDSKGYKGDTGNNGGDAGPLKPYKVFGAYISSQHKIDDIDFKRTSLDAKGTLQQTMSIAVEHKADEKVLKSIKDKDSDLTKQDFSSGTAKGIDDEKVIRALVGKIAVAHASAAMTPDGQKGVSVLINLKDWEILVQSNYFLNADFKESIEWGDNERPTRIKGAEFLVTKNDDMVPSGTIYIVPSNTCGFATWKGTEKGVAEYHETDGARWHLQNRKYVGAICIEPKFITKFTFKATA